MKADSFWRAASAGAFAVPLSLGLLSYAPAHADVSAYVSTSNTYDNNIFRLSGSQNYPGASRGDDVTFLDGGGVFNLRGDSYLFTASADAGESFFLKNKFLNAPSYDGAFDFKYHQKIIDLDLQGSVSEQLSSFGDIRAPIRNLQSLTRVGGRFGVAVSSDIKVIADIKYFRGVDSSAEIAQADYDQTEFGLGIGYFSPAGNSVILEDLQAETRGLNDQPFAINDETLLGRINYSDNTILLQVKYSPDPLFGFYAQGGYLNRTDKSILHNNVQTPIATVKFVYKPDSNWWAALSAGRQLSTQSYILISSVDDNYVKFSPVLQMANGLQLTADVNYDQRHFGSAPELGFGALNISDQTLRYDAAVNYLLLERLGLSLMVYHEERHSNSPLDTYNANGAMITLRLQTAQPPVKDALPENSDFLLFQ